MTRLTAIQIQYLKDWKHRFFILPAGRRSRKTLLGKFKVILDRGLEGYDKRYFLGAPTHRQAKRIFWEDLKKYTYYFRKSISESEKVVTLLTDTEIHVIGLDKPERIEGSPWHGCFITEMPNVKDGAWESHIRPVLSDTRGFALLDGVPEGMNFYYDMALRACGGVLPKTLPGEGAYGENGEWCYYSWFSSDVLDPAEIEAARIEYNPKLYRQEYEGSFESYEGLAYWAFSKKNLMLCEYNPTQIVQIGIDFNIDPMTAVLCHVVSDNVYQFGEVFLPNSNTYEMRDYLLKKFPVGRVQIYPDSTGKRSTSNATVSDIAILKKAGFDVKARNSNPPQKDRVNAVNTRMMDGSGKVHYFINPRNCPKTMNDLNKVESLPDGRLNKNQEKQKLVHLTDGLGYLVHYLFPIKKVIAMGVPQ